MFTHSRPRLMLLKVCGAIALLLMAPVVGADPESDSLESRIDADPVPAMLCANAHFVASDEGAHWLFRPSTQDLGGVFLGVGTDQNYVMAGWARPQVLILMDFDPVVVDIHRIYRAFFGHAETAEAFLELWRDDRTKEALAVLQRIAGDEPTRSRIERNFLKYRKKLQSRLAWIVRAYGARDVPTFLSDVSQYTFLRNAVVEGRVVVARGDLIGANALEDIGRVLTERNLLVRVLYLSNAEKYFRYTAQFRRNILGLPMDDKTVILRTSGAPADEWLGDGFYRYFVQSGNDFRAWLESPKTADVMPIRRHRNRGAEKGLYLLSGPTDKQR